MKKLFIAALIIVAAATSAFAAAPKTENSNAKSTFKTSFRKATNVTWTATPEFTKASFDLYDLKMEAFFNTDGEVIATSLKVTLDEIPVSAKRNIAKKYDGYTMKDIVKIETPDEGAYYISAEGPHDNVILKVSDSGLVSVFQKSAR